MFAKSTRDDRVSRRVYGQSRRYLARLHTDKATPCETPFLIMTSKLQST